MWERRPWRPRQGLAEENPDRRRSSKGLAISLSPFPSEHNFLALWKDADPDIPILKQAKAEYAKLR
jgi:hypothetical protein